MTVYFMAICYLVGVGVLLAVVAMTLAGTPPG
jgi:hypothetical protein